MNEIKEEAEGISTVQKIFEELSQYPPIEVGKMLKELELMFLAELKEHITVREQDLKQAHCSLEEFNTTLKS